MSLPSSDLYGLLSVSNNSHKHVLEASHSNNNPLLFSCNGRGVDDEFNQFLYPKGQWPTRRMLHRRREWPLRQLHSLPPMLSHHTGVAQHQGHRGCDEPLRLLWICRVFRSILQFTSTLLGCSSTAVSKNSSGYSGKYCDPSLGMAVQAYFKNRTPNQVCSLIPVSHLQSRILWRESGAG